MKREHGYPPSMPTRRRPVPGGRSAVAPAWRAPNVRRREGGIVANEDATTGPRTFVDSRGEKVRFGEVRFDATGPARGPRRPVPSDPMGVLVDRACTALSALAVALGLAALALTAYPVRLPGGAPDVRGLATVPGDDVPGDDAPRAGLEATATAAIDPRSGQR